jgi:hypothetical protein
MFDPDAHMPRINRGMVYLGACLIAGIRLARESYRDRIEDAPMPVACPTRPSNLGILADISGLIWGVDRPQSPMAGPLFLLSWLILCVCQDTN